MKTSTIAVLGSLGGQGGSVVDSLLKDGSFNIRGVTSNVNSEKAKAMEKRGVTMVSGNVKEPNSLRQAFDGADTAFVVVNFWDPAILTREGDLTKDILRVAKDSGVKHIIYSSLANVDAITGGQINVPHFSLKAEAWQYATSELDFETIAAVEPAAYYSNWFTFFKAVEDEEGTLVWTWPGKGKSFSQFDVNTGTGPAVLKVAKEPAKFNGQHILLEAAKLSPDDIASKIAKKLGKKGRVDYVDPTEFAKTFDGASELAQMVKWFDDYGYYGPETETRKHSSGKDLLGSDLLSFDEWLDSEASLTYLQT